MSAVAWEEAVAFLDLDLTRHRCNSHEQSSHGRVRGVCGHLEISEAPKMISGLTPSSAMWPRLDC